MGEDLGTQVLDLVLAVYFVSNHHRAVFKIPDGRRIGLTNTGWCFGTCFMNFHILGISSSQLTNSIIFQRGRHTTNQNIFGMIWCIFLYRCVIGVCSIAWVCGKPDVRLAALEFGFEHGWCYPAPDPPKWSADHQMSRHLPLGVQSVVGIYNAAVSFFCHVHPFLQWPPLSFVFGLFWASRPSSTNHETWSYVIIPVVMV